MRVDDVKPHAAAAAELRAGAQSAKGLREENQDAMTRFGSRFGEVILVADGMGGHQGGAVASDMVAQRFRFYLDGAAETTTSLGEALQRAAMQVNDEIYERGHGGDPAVAGMGSTLVVAVVRRSGAGYEVIVANAGDSRAYLLREGVLRQLTRDHTAAQRMVEAGMLSPADARHHPQASVLSRALGQQIGTTVEIYPPVSMLPGDGLLLCSDGLSGFALDPDIAGAIGSASDPNAVVRNLVELALRSGSDDNITVQFLRLGSAIEFPPLPVTAAVVRPPNRRLAPLVILAVLILGVGAWAGYRFIYKPVVPVKKDLKRTLPIDGRKQQKKTDAAEKKSTAADPHGQQAPPPVHGETGSNPEQPGAPAPSAQPVPRQGDNEGEGTGSAAPAAQQHPSKLKSVVVYLPDHRDVPDWLPDLKKLAFVSLLDSRKQHRIKPDSEEILVFYRASAKDELDRMGRKIEPLRDARQQQDDALPAGTDIMIVMPK